MDTFYWIKEEMADKNKKEKKKYIFILFVDLKGIK